MCARKDSGLMLRGAVGALAEAVERLAPPPPFRSARVLPAPMPKPEGKPR